MVIPQSALVVTRRLCLIWLSRAPLGVKKQGKVSPMAIYALDELVPSIDPTAYIHPMATVIGNVTIGPESSVWPGAVLRGDRGGIRIGSQTSVQDGVVIHCTEEHDTVVGDRCVIGHNAHLEGCTVMDDSLIGSGSVVLHQALVGPHSLVGASALVPNRCVVPPRARALGVPAKITLDSVAEDEFLQGVRTYVSSVHQYRAGLRQIS